MRERAVRSTLRTRWAAVGAALAITFGGSGIAGLVDAATGAESAFVPITPVRVLDSRDGIDVGLNGPFTSGVSQKLQITGPIATVDGETKSTQTVVPAGATGVSLNVTVFQPTSLGFISVRPGSATTDPATANLTFDANDIVPNAVNVAVPTTGANTGQLDLWYQGTSAGERADLIIDVVGYYTPVTSTGGTPGPAGQDGADAPRPNNTIWVAKSGGDFTSVQAAIDSIGDASATNPYLIEIAPGAYSGKVVLKSHVSLRGSGAATTTLTSNGAPGPAGASGDFNAARIAQATVNATGVNGVSIENLRIESVATGANSATGLVHLGQTNASELTVHKVAIEARSARDAYGLDLRNSRAELARVDIVATSTGAKTATPEPFVRGVATQQVDGGIGGAPGLRLNDTDIVAAGLGNTVGFRAGAGPELTAHDLDIIASGDPGIGLLANGLQTVTISDSVFEARPIDGADMVDPAVSTSAGAAGTVTINDSRVFGPLDIAGSGVTRIANSLISDTVTGFPRCVDTYDSARQPLAVDCRPITEQTIRWAKVDADNATPGTESPAPLLAHAGAVSVRRNTTGEFDVRFDGVVAGCAWTATRNDNGAGAASAGEISIELRDSSNPDQLRIRTFDSDGSPEDPNGGDGFTVTVICDG